MTNDKDSAVLLPCPFCGNDGNGPIEYALHICFDDMPLDLYTVQCDKCTATMGKSPSEAEAIAAWNTRQPTQSDALQMDAALMSAYAQGFADGAEDQRNCEPGETPHKDCISEGFQNWLANNPSIRATLQEQGK